MPSANITRARLFRCGVALAAVLFFVRRFTEYASVDYPVQDRPMARRFDNWTFEWEDVDTATSGLCGGFKCFFLSRAYPQSVGYLVVPEKAAQSFKKGQRAKEFGENLQEQFPALKILTPWNVELRYMSEDNAHKLNSNLYLLKTGDISNKSHYAEGNVTVYTVPTAPTPNYLLKGRLFGNKVATLVKKQMDSNPDFDLTRWNENFRTSIDVVLQLLPAEPCLCKDFQVLLEVPTGHLWHFDLDRCFEGHENKRKGTVTVSKLIYYDKGVHKALAKFKTWPQAMEGAFRKLGLE